LRLEAVTTMLVGSCQGIRMTAMPPNKVWSRSNSEECSSFSVHRSHMVGMVPNKTSSQVRGIESAPIQTIVRANIKLLQSPDASAPV
jgi:hypothetical protein